MIQKSITLLLLSLCFVTFCETQRPKLTNAQVQEVSVTGGLQSTVNSITQKQEGPAWIGYRIPASPKERTLCCNRHCVGCNVESNGSGSFVDSASDCEPPEPLRYAFVFLRMEQQKIQKVRVYSASCGLDFANLPLYWLENVSPSESVALLSNLVVTPAPETDGKMRRRAIWRTMPLWQLPCMTIPPPIQHWRS